MKISTILKWISGGLEAFWGIPLVGGTIILGLYWLPLVFMFILHIVTLVFSLIERKKFHGSIMGIVTSCLAWIPFLGMIMHILTAIFLLIDAYQAQKENNEFA
ncbi:hypothetical protein D8M04_04660 [Oceanobacillus piezotolerans]|uniref:Uncharacterized protein n=1 Tax=Oceanobacillus piezotolerans TaxID=2448030 RepID=A0A498D807_9BACI|nr:hypothetical protein [Oceanobacillus piezotolerans]RLL46503.1 hypothetical protein D8M04_04660 [Oceanobacillus piezotolerans]